LAGKLRQFEQQLGGIKLVPSRGGVFEVSLGGEKLYSKRETGKFPDFDAIVAAVKAKL
jgi:selenoprotein W-related protein